MTGPHRPDEAARTRVRLEHRGWDRLGPVGGPRRERTASVWHTPTPLYAAAAELR